MALFEEKPGRVFRDAACLQPLSPPPGGVPICRENDLKFMANYLAEVFRTGQGRNLFIYGKPGTGKTVCAQYLLKEIQRHADDKGLAISTVYVNAGKTRTPYYTMVEIVEGLGLRVPEAGWQMFRLKQAFENMLAAKAVVIAIDEVDIIFRKEKEPLVYYLNRQPKTTLILISNKIEDAARIPERALSTLQPKLVSLNPYTPKEAKEILKDRASHAFQPDALPDKLLEKVAKLTAEAGDIRLGLSTLLSAGIRAERAGRTKITIEDIQSAFKSEKTTEILKAIGILKKHIQKRKRKKKWGSLGF
ncbi:MAG: AAA family ATPase [Candidatus Bathyarchaeia archaeon]